MAKVEVDQTEVDFALEQNKLFNDLLADPNTALDFKRMMKKVRPEIAIPDLDAIDHIAHKTKELEEKAETGMKQIQSKLESFEEERKQERAQKELQGKLDTVKKNWGFTDEGMEKVVKHMFENKHTDVAAAAAFVASQNPTPQPVKSTNLFPQEAKIMEGIRDNYYGKTDDEFASLLRDPQRVADSIAEDMLMNPDKYPEMQ